MIKIANHSVYHKGLARQLVEQVRDYHVDHAFVLTITDRDISLCSEIHQQNTCYTHSFSDPKLKRRAAQKNQALLKACNNKKRSINSVLDLTAGWGKDSYILASHDQQVQMIEQNPLLYHCLDYLLGIANKDDPDPLFKRLQVIHQNSVDYLMAQTALCADCLYLDPMFPEHKSTARPAKDLQLLQLLTENIAIDQLFELALQKAGQRVVVKRPLHAPTLNAIKPDIVYREKTIRFDVYLTANRGN